jgi:hypothetical protein
VTLAGAISLGAALGVLLAQRMAPRPSNAVAAGIAVACVAVTVSGVAGLTAAAAVVAVTPLGYMLRRLA